VVLYAFPRATWERGKVKYNLEMNGYVTTNEISYSNGYGSYSLYGARASTGNPGMMFKAGNRRIKYDLLGE